MSIGRTITRALVGVLALGALVVQGGAAWGANWLVHNDQWIKDTFVAQQFVPAPEITDYVAEAGLSAEGELYLLTSQPQIVTASQFDRYCTRNEPGIGVLGCYTLADKRIYLFDVTDARLTSIEPVVAAHEMLHSAWARLSAGEKESLAGVLEEAFAALPADHPLRDRIRSYEADRADSRIPELYSILGTEIAPLPDALEAHYARFFADRSKVVAHADAVYAVFDTLQDRLVSLSNELTSRSAEIDGLRYTYREENDSLRADIIAFNERASTPGGFPVSKSQFEQARQPLVDRQVRLEEMRVSLQTKITEYNALLNELTVLNDEVSELNQGINVTLETQDELQSTENDISDN